MNSKHSRLCRAWIFVIGAHLSAFGQVAGGWRSVGPAAAAPAGPVITILAAATGALLRSQAASRASLDLGRVSYFNGQPAAGASRQKNAGALVLSTHFGLRVDCPGTPTSKVTVRVSRLDGADSHAIRVDGSTLGSVAHTLVQSMSCGSSGEHRLELEVPVSTPAGSIGSTVAFVATLNK